MNLATKAHNLLSRMESLPINEIQWLAPLIDHTLLKPEATESQIAQLCSEAVEHGFKTVCVNPFYVSAAVKALRGKGVGVVSVIGFPQGTVPTAEKVREAKQALAEGATELDMVIQLGWLKERKLREVFGDIQAVVEAAGPVPVKAILETSTLSPEEKVMAGSLAKAAGVAFLKTSTGFAPGGATVEDVALLKNIAGDQIEVKASGGIRTLKAALEMVAAGATRLGTSSGLAILGKSPSNSASY